MTDAQRAALHALADELGVATSYVDGTGVVRTPPDSTIEAIVEVLAGRVLDAARSPEHDVGRCAHGPQPERSWGVFAPLAGLRSGREVGLGDLTTLRTFAESAVDLGARVVGTLPLLATRPDEASPYSPLTLGYWDERWLDPAWLAQRLGLDSERMFGSDTPEDRTHPEPAWQLRRSHVRRLFTALDEWPTDEFPAWRAAHPDVEMWARWKAAAAVVGWDPRAWPADLDGAVRRGDLLTLAEHGVRAEDVDVEVVYQWAVSTQLAELGADLRADDVALYLDLPVGTSASGFDVWESPDDFAVGMTIGAPPDRFFPGGQSWGLVPRMPGRGDLRRCVEAHMAVCGLLRIDHVMGLHRLFWIPDGCDASDGTYVTYPAAEQWAVVAELSRKYDCGVVGEDLGTVPDEVRESMAAVGARGLFIAQDETRSPFRLGRPVPAATVASLNTHDLPPVAAWHAEAGLPTTASAAEVRDHLLAELAASEADIVLVAEQDLSLDPRRLNVPGEVGGDIWRLVARTDARELGVGGVLAHVDAWRRTPRGAWPAGTPCLLDDGDIASFHAGTHARLADRLGVHPRTAAGMVGASAAVWAPHATEVCVAGEFDGWSGSHLRRRGDSGVWEGFVPAAMLGDRYKLHVRGADGEWHHKSDPFARASELPPGNASIITADDPAEAGWHDDEWMAGRAERQAPGRPMSIYELHLGSWRRHEDGRVPTYAEVTPWLIEYVQRMGFTHVELMPVMEHPFGGSWGYHVTGYFAPTTRYGTPAEFATMVDDLHRAGIGVILDWVPAHFPEDAHGLADFDGQPLFEYPDPREGRHPEWGSRVFDFGRPEVRAFLVSSARWWIERFHADGLRVDAVASMLHRDYAREPGEWVPNVHGGRENLEAVDLVRRLTHEIHASTPGALVIAEESTAWPGVTAPPEQGGLGFDLKWDLGWMHDTLEYLGRDPIHRSWHQDELTFRAMYATSERFALPLSHDEVVHGKASLVGKMAGDDWQRRANLRLLFGNQFLSPGVPVLFMGGELAMNEEWDHDTALPWHLLDYPDHRGVQAWVAELNRLRLAHPALTAPSTDTATFQWLDCDDRQNSVVSWVRRGPGGDVMVVANFTPNPHEGYRIPFPTAGRWRLVANSDDRRWGGSGYPTSEFFETEPIVSKEWGGSALVTLPPLALTVLTRT